MVEGEEEKTSTPWKGQLQVNRPDKDEIEKSQVSAYHYRRSPSPFFHSRDEKFSWLAQEKFVLSVRIVRMELNPCVFP